LIHSDVKLAGSIAQYGRGSGMIQSVASQLIAQFGSALKAQIEQSRSQPAAAAEAVLAPAKPVSGLTLIARALWNSIVRLFRKHPNRQD
jgi:hypothetical protein